jgi:hypothetical protein
MIKKMIEFNMDKEFLFKESEYLRESQEISDNENKYLLEEKLLKQIFVESINFSKIDLDYTIKLLNSKGNYQNEIPIWLHNAPKPLH